MSFSISDTRFDLPDRLAVRVLREDLIGFERELEANWSDGRLRRSYVRAALALVDAIVNYIKHMAYNFATQMVRPVQQHLGPNLWRCPVKAIARITTDGELSLLRDQIPSVKRSGEINVATVFLDFRRNVKFAFKSSARIFDAEIDLNFAEDARWVALSKAAETRNRIVHPKSGDSMYVSDDEIESVRAGYAWIVLKEIELTLAIGKSAIRILSDLTVWLEEFEPAYMSELQAQVDGFKRKWPSQLVE